MSQHVFARVAGFKLTVIPRAPYRVTYADVSSSALDVEYQSPHGRLFARLIPQNGGYKSRLDQHTESLFDVLDVEDGPDLTAWRIETTIFTCCWPRGYALCSTDFPKDPGPFDLIGNNGEMIYVQHPRRVPDLAEMAAPGQIVMDLHRGTESEWIDLQYDHEGSPWRQRHEVVDLLGRRVVITMQSPSQFADGAGIAAQQLLQSLAPYQGQSKGSRSISPDQI